MTGISLLKEAKTWHYKDRIILTDPPETTRRDAVFPLCHENLYFVENFVIPEDSVVLDLCTGSGIIAIFAAETAKKVIAVDMNPRAIEYAKLNAELNGVIHKIDFRNGNLFEPVKGMKFDVITANPPFEPTPNGHLNFLHSDGGEDGVIILQEIITRAPDYLLPNGSLQMVFYLKEDRLEILSILERRFKEVFVNELGIISAKAYNSYLESKLFLLNDAKHLTISNEFPIRYLYIRADGLRNEH